MTQSEVRYDLSFFDFPDFDECPFANETFFDSSPTSVEPFADALTCHVNFFFTKKGFTFRLVISLKENPS